MVSSGPLLFFLLIFRCHFFFVHWQDSERKTKIHWLGQICKFHNRFSIHHNWVGRFRTLRSKYFDVTSQVWIKDFFGVRFCEVRFKQAKYVHYILKESINWRDWVASHWSSLKSNKTHHFEMFCCQVNTLNLSQ